MKQKISYWLDEEVSTDEIDLEEIEGLVSWKEDYCVSSSFPGLPIRKW